MHDIDRTFMEAEAQNFEFAAEQWGEEEVLGEDEVDELAAELLSVSSEAELDHFLGGLIKKAAGAVKKFASGPLGKQIGGMLKGVAKNALPMAGAALGNMVLPGIGGAIGGNLASTAGSMFGLELEGLSHEDQQFEVAKQIVRLGADATKTAVTAPPGRNPASVARDSMVQAAQKLAPGLLGADTRPGGRTNGGRPSGAAQGKWIRRGGRIILLGV